MANKPYAVWAPAFDNSAGGIVCLHRIAVELQKKGQKVFISTDVQNPRWDRVPVWYNDDPDTIAIYPEVVWGSPFVSKTIVRYLLNLPGVINGPSELDDTSIYYIYSRLFNTKVKLPEDRILFTPILELDIFYDMKLKREGRLVYRGKGRQKEDERLRQFPSLGGKEDHKGEDKQKILAEKLNRAELLYTYDNITAITDIARLCGCPVVVLMDGTYSYNEFKQAETYHCGGIGYDLIEAPIARATIDSEYMAKCYAELEVKFQEQLSEMIKLTQGA